MSLSIHKKKLFVLCVTQITLYHTLEQIHTCIPQIQKLRSILSTRPELLQFRHPIRLPLDPSVKVTGILSEQASLFKSALIPARLCFNTDKGDVYWVSMS